MGKTKIEWATDTWNPTTGCDQVSPGCDNCYAKTMAKRLKAMGSPDYQTDGDPRTSGPGFAIAMHPHRLDQPLRWTKPRNIFVNSMSDLFHSGVTDDFIAQVWAVMALSPQHTFQVLTKRHGRMRSLLSGDQFHDHVQEAMGSIVDAGAVRGTAAQNVRRRRSKWLSLTSSWPLPNVWLGVSVEDQKRAEMRVAALLETPAAVRFLSMEPLLSGVNLRHLDVERHSKNMYVVDALTGRHTDMARPCPDVPKIDWVIVGGESGRDARPMHIGWVRALRDQCTAAGVPFLLKQWGEWLPVYGRPQHGDWWLLGRGYGSVKFGSHEEVGSTAMQKWKPGDRGAEPGKWDPYGDVVVRRVGKKTAGRWLDGCIWDEYPIAANDSKEADRG